MNSQVFSNLNDSVLTQPASVIVHNNKEATAYVQKVKVALPAFPTWLQLHQFDSFTAAPVLLKSLLSAVVGNLPFFALFSETFSQLKLVQKIQQGPERAHTRFRRTLQVPHWLWWAAPSANSMWWNYTLNFCVTLNNWSSIRGKSTGGLSDHQGGRQPPGQGQPLPAALHQESLSTAQGWPCQLCSHSCYWILSQPEELINSAFQAQSLHWARHLSSFKCSCSFNWPEAVNGGKQQLLFILVWNALKQMITDRKCYSLKKEKRKGS